MDVLFKTKVQNAPFIVRDRKSLKRSSRNHLFSLPAFLHDSYHDQSNRLEGKNDIFVTGSTKLKKKENRNSSRGTIVNKKGIAFCYRENEGILCRTFNSKTLSIGFVFSSFVRFALWRAKKRKKARSSFAAKDTSFFRSRFANTCC